MSLKPYTTIEPSRAEIDAQQGPLLLEFGSNTCGYCQAVKPLLQEALGAAPELAHIRIEDGRGRPLGRSFRVTLWPTLIFLQHGTEVARLVRPHSAAEIREALDLLQTTPG